MVGRVDVVYANDLGWLYLTEHGDLVGGGLDKRFQASACDLCFYFEPVSAASREINNQLEIDLPDQVTILLIAPLGSLVVSVWSFVHPPLSAPGRRGSE